MGDQSSESEVARVRAAEAPAGAGARRIGRGVFTRGASGRSTSPGQSEGITRVIFDEADDRAIGASTIGPKAGDMIAAAALTIGTDADAVDLGHTIRSHPTPSETVNLAAVMSGGTITDLIPPRKRS